MPPLVLVESLLPWIAGGLSLAMLGLLAVRMWRAIYADPLDSPGGDRQNIRRVHLDEAPGVVLEIAERWPARTRIRIAAPSALPIDAPARLSPRGLRPGRRLSPAFGDLTWTGRGADQVAIWSEQLEEPLRALWGWRDRYTLQATLTPFGLMVHMPLVAAQPNEEAFLLLQARRLYDALAVLAGADALEGISFQTPLAEPEGECSTCWESVSRRDAVHCPSCGGRQHHDCHAWNGGCGRFACDGVDRLGRSLGDSRSFAD